MKPAIHPEYLSGQSLVPRYIALGLFLVLLNCKPLPPDPRRFQEEVRDLQSRYEAKNTISDKTILFTGSSSIRLWDDLEKRFSEFDIVNTGFGGSQTSDLLAYSNELILQYKPAKVFIYEGDNDLAEGSKRPEIVIRDIETLTGRIWEQDPNTPVVLISAKPSITRWQLRHKYRKLNRKLLKLCEADPRLEYADIWTPMLNGKELRRDLFDEDGLHMNKK